MDHDATILRTVQTRLFSHPMSRVTRDPPRGDRIPLGSKATGQGQSRPGWSTRTPITPTGKPASTGALYRSKRRTRVQGGENAGKKERRGAPIPVAFNVDFRGGLTLQFGGDDRCLAWEPLRCTGLNSRSMTTHRPGGSARWILSFHTATPAPSDPIRSPVTTRCIADTGGRLGQKKRA